MSVGEHNYRGCAGRQLGASHHNRGHGGPDLGGSLPTATGIYFINPHGYLISWLVKNSCTRKIRTYQNHDNLSNNEKESQVEVDHFQFIFNLTRTFFDLPFNKSTTMIH